jgi:PAS domain S-box-containing protein
MADPSPMDLLSMDEAVALLTEYQDRLDRARLEGPTRYEAVFANSPAGVGVHEIDQHRVIRRVNAVEAEILGYAPDELVGREVHDFIVMSEASQRAIEKKLSGGVALKPFVRTFRRADGSAVAMALVDRHLKDAAGAVTGIRTALCRIAG